MKKNISILLCGEAGQGMQTLESILVRIFKNSGFNVYATKEYMSRIRGGSNSVQIRISQNEVRAPVCCPDIAMLLDNKAFNHIKDRIGKNTYIFADTAVVGDLPKNYYDIQLMQQAKDIGNKIYVNIIAAGVLSSIVGAALDIALGVVQKRFSKKGEDILLKNTTAIKRGYEIANNMFDSGALVKDCFLIAGGIFEVKQQILCNGAEAVSMGALAGGCNFVSSYPMSPSTGVLTFMAQHSKGHDVIVEQAEDEISAINMIIGAWYAGARAMATTSGGGFALMEEGVSLSAMLETPAVVHIAQRPGPATGLPTRTEQGDLELVLYSGHGEFPRAIFAPGTLEDAFLCAQRAFYIADKYQSPVFILTDQYLIDTYYNCPPFDILEGKADNHIIETEQDYMRYAMTDSGVSPRGIPGFGKGLVLVDSDEHDTEGRITESMHVRTQMVDKRLKKMEGIKSEVFDVELTGEPEGKTLLICWGSTYLIVKEAVQRLANDDLVIAYFKQVYPLPDNISACFNKAKKRVIIENNATSQFSKLLKLHAGVEVDEKILKYDGLPFFVDELSERLKSVI